MSQNDKLLEMHAYFSSVLQCESVHSQELHVMYVTKMCTCEVHACSSGFSCVASMRTHASATHKIIIHRF